MFGESEDNVTLALVDAVVEKVVHVAPPLVLYCQISTVEVELTEILKPFAVIAETEKVTVGTARSMVLSVTL